MIFFNKSVLPLAVFAIIAVSCGEKPSEETYKVPDSPRALNLTPFSALNAGEQLLDSHANDWNESRLVPEYFTYRNLYSDILRLPDPHYPRMTRLADGSYILMYHDADGGTVNGGNVYYATSPDLRSWECRGSLFSERAVVTSQGKSTTRIYTNGYVLSLSNGDLLAIASYRVRSYYNLVTSQPDHGIELKRSRDCGLSWSDAIEIYHGTNWEGQLFELPSGQIQCYFSESRPWISGGHSGTGMIWSDDGGATWVPDRVGDPHTVAREKYVHYESGLTLFSYQMPAVIKLNEGELYAGAFETRKNKSSSYGISMAWSDGFWKELLDEDTSYPEVKDETCGPADRKSYAWNGSAPTMFQFPSGETVIGYTNSSHLCIRMGDALARTFTNEMVALPNQGSWGQVSLMGTHEMCAVNRDSKIASKVGISYELYALNHRIEATSRKVTFDGRNDEWAETDEALFVGSKQKAYATLRCSADSKNLYFLIEVLDEDIKSGDNVELFLAPYNTTSLSASCIKLQADCLGNFTAERYSSTWNPEDFGAMVYTGYEGSPDDNSDIDSGCLFEIKIPRKAIDTTGGAVMVNYSLTKQGGATDTLADIHDPADWIPILGL